MQNVERRTQNKTRELLTAAKLHAGFEELYRKWNRREFVHPDPLQFVLGFNDPADQEVAGLVSSSLAYGKVGHILKSLERIFEVLERPSADLDAMSKKELKDAFRAFRHRWTTGEEVAYLLTGISLLRKEYGSLEKCFQEGCREGDQNVIPALVNFVARLRKASGRQNSSLLACPSVGSACKRMFLYLRWMIRSDEVDPGPWTQVNAAGLIVPMDTHMHRISLSLGLTSRRQADLKCALQVTDFFRTLVPDDPVKYDFALTRPGIRSEPGSGAILDQFPAQSESVC